MSENTLFWWLVRDHIERDWTKVRPHVREGVMNLIGDEPVVLGRTENPYYGGALVLANGATLVEKLIATNAVLDDTIPPPTILTDFSSLKAYFGSMDDRKEDGAFIIDQEAWQIYNVANLNNSPGDQRVPVREFVPADFRSADSSRLVFGTKSYLTIALPQLYQHAQALQISRTAFTSLGMGKVVHTDRFGLLQEFFLQYEPNGEKPFIDTDNGVVGVHREYSPGYRASNGTRQDRYVTMDEIMQRTSYTPRELVQTA